MTIKEAAIDRKNNLNIIRLIASLMVLYMHSFAICIGNQSKDIMYTLTNHKSLSGGVAVYIFFIISGFLICRSFDRSSSVLSYAKSRFLRIWPLFFIVISVSTFIIGPIFTEYPLWIYFKSEILDYFKTLTFISSDALLPGTFQYHYNHSINGSIWTLAYEVLWYIIVVLISPLWKKHKSFSFVLWLLLGGIYISYKYLGASVIPFVPVDFMINFSMLGLFFTTGMIFYLYENKIVLSFKLFVIAFTGLILGILFAEFVITFAIFGSYIIFYIAFQKKFIATWYDKIGDLSYGIYIMAFPIQQVLCECMGSPTKVYNTMSMNPYINMLVTLIIIIPLAWCSWNFIEQPCLKLKNK